MAARAGPALAPHYSDTEHSMHAIIGGTQTMTLPVLEGVRSEVVETPYGMPSGAVSIGSIGGRDFAFLPRHGNPHMLPPHKINYRANLWALRKLGVTSVVAICTSGGLADRFGPGTIVCPDQIIDYTWGREHTLSDGLTTEPVVHVDFTIPFTGSLRHSLLNAALLAKVSVFDGGCYACFNGPRLETAAEIRALARDGCDLVGQTMMPEAALARELGLDYAALCPIVNHAAGLGDSRNGISRAELRATREAAMERVMQLLVRFALAESAAT